jgi:hypothetical protein
VIASILDSVKKVLGVEPAYTAFDEDIMMHINSALATLHQLGIGPEFGFAIEDNSATWADFIGTDPRFSQAKTYVYLCVKILWDRVETGYLLEALKQQKLELEVRLNMYREGTQWVNPFGLYAPLEDIIDGGTP